ncbi:hypothetical protein RBB79_14585 [Tunturiibacter empetritectus]|uniref:Uncharacterized protein n=2 Tax=Tunturiibacter TaxID=3154218 RepID=A0A852VN80_9BACT|nr:hypothetical protein [Edaphobacter lichenicola]NYF90842.1 hypothetical protein [Edaphobacter lichenicola]
MALERGWAWGGERFAPAGANTPPYRDEAAKGWGTRLGTAGREQRQDAGASLAHLTMKLWCSVDDGFVVGALTACWMG